MDCLYRATEVSCNGFSSDPRKNHALSDVSVITWQAGHDLKYMRDSPWILLWGLYGLLLWFKKTQLKSRMSVKAYSWKPYYRHVDKGVNNTAQLTWYIACMSTSKVILKLIECIEMIVRKNMRVLKCYLLGTFLMGFGIYPLLVWQTRHRSS